MNNIEKIIENSNSPGEFARGYMDYLKKIFDCLDFRSLDKLVLLLDSARKKGNTIFVAGNGGSAATAITMANDLGFDVLKKSGTEKTFRIISLTDNPSVLTAIANDTGYENIFLNQIKIHYRKGDMLLAISASGNSPNVVLAAEWVKKQGGRVASFVGFDGGRLKEISDVSIHISAEKGEYGPVEDAHLILNHILAHWFQLKSALSG